MSNLTVNISLTLFKTRKCYINISMPKSAPGTLGNMGTHWALRHPWYIQFDPEIFGQWQNFHSLDIVHHHNAYKSKPSICDWRMSALIKGFQQIVNHPFRNYRHFSHSLSIFTEKKAPSISLFLVGTNGITVRFP